MRSSLHIVIFFCISLVASAAYSNEPVTNFPKYEFPQLIGNKATTESNKGKVVVLNFWFTNCPPCISEIEKLNLLVSEYKGKNVRFIAPTFDSKELVTTFLKKYPFNYEIVGFGQNDPSVYFQDKKIIFPTHIVIDTNGRLIYRATSEADLPALRQAINHAL